MLLSLFLDGEFNIGIETVGALTDAFLKLDDINLLIFDVHCTLLDVEIAGTCCNSLLNLFQYIFNSSDDLTDDYYDYDD